MSPTNTCNQPSRSEEALTSLIGALVLVTAGTGVFVPGFYDGIVDPLYTTGTIPADAVSLICVPLLVVSMLWARRTSPVARLIWVSLVAYLAYAYATYVFDRMYTILFPLYMGIFSLSCFVVVSILTRLDVHQLAEYSQELRLRRVTSIFLIFTGLILYAIELPIILFRMPGGIHAGGTPFMVLDMSLVAPISILTGVWLWQRRPWGAALAAIFLIKAITLMSGFLIADYTDWYAGRLTTQGVTIAFTVVYLLVYFFTWNYFAAFSKQAKLVGATSQIIR